jgi:hypothetical protein
MSAASCADALISGWVSRFGVPSLITSDRGTQFTSAVWEALCNKLGVAHTTTKAPPTGKWPSGEGPQAVEGGPEEQTGRRRLA